MTAVGVLALFGFGYVTTNDAAAELEAQAQRERRLWFIAELLTQCTPDERAELVTIEQKIKTSEAEFDAAIRARDRLRDEDARDLGAPSPEPGSAHTNVILFRKPADSNEDLNTCPADSNEDLNTCPKCRRREGVSVLNVERDHWVRCSACRIRWCIGSNLLCAWRDETPEVWVENAAFLAGYAPVEYDDALAARLQ